MRKLLWIGDAACDSGFARATHYTLETLRKTWDVSVLGLNYRGDPHDYPYPIYPCFPGGDIFGFGRIHELIGKIGPDVVVVQNDPWNLPEYMKLTPSIPTIGALAVDGKNCAGRGLNGLALAIFWTQFALNEARRGGYMGPAAVVPLGVDLKVYYPEDQAKVRHLILGPKAEARMGQDAFIVGNVNRNQPRKRLDLCISYFAEWVKTREVKNAYLYLHVAPTGDDGYDCAQLASYYGIQSRLILAQPDPFHGATEEQLRMTYNCFDVMFTTTQGEGWGLPTLEGMACGIPQIVPDWSALGEWASEGALMVPCTTIAVTPNKINVIGGVMDREEGICALDRIYRDTDARYRYQEAARKTACQPEYRWEAIGEAFTKAIDEAMANI